MFQDIHLRVQFGVLVSQRPQLRFGLAYWVAGGRRRIGRGGKKGTYSGRGMKGQKSRSGHNIPRRFEGGQTPLVMRLHKLPGFKSYKPKAQIISLDNISANFKNGETVSTNTLIEKGIIKKGQRVKILSSGKLSVKVSIEGIKTSKAAQAIIEKFSNDTKKPEIKKATSAKNKVK